MKWTNPQSTMAQQLGIQDEKLLAMALWVMAKKGVVRITVAEMEACLTEFPNGPVVFTHGVGDVIELSLLAPERAEEIAKYEATRRGGA